MISPYHNLNGLYIKMFLYVNLNFPYIIHLQYSTQINTLVVLAILLLLVIVASGAAEIVVSGAAEIVFKFTSCYISSAILSVMFFV